MQKPYEDGWKNGAQAMQVEAMSYIDFIKALYADFDTENVGIEDVLAALRAKIATSSIPGMWGEHGPTVIGEPVIPTGAISPEPAKPAVP